MRTGNRYRQERAARAWRVSRLIQHLYHNVFAKIKCTAAPEVEMR